MMPPPDPHDRHVLLLRSSPTPSGCHVFSLGLRDVELILAEHGVVVSCETVRRWCKKGAAALRLPTSAEALLRGGCLEPAAAYAGKTRPDYCLKAQDHEGRIYKSVSQ
jgi:hypothetical protein